MAHAWLELGGGQRHELKHGLNTLGGPHGEISVEGSGSDSLHLWDDPPRLVFAGKGPLPRVNGRAVEEVELQPGDTIEWHARAFVLGIDEDRASLEPIPVDPPVEARAASPAAPDRAAFAQLPAWRRLKAGMLVELDLADRELARRWQNAVRQGDFDPDACARDLLGATGDRSGVSDEDPRLMERSGRLLRDLLMAPVLRGMRGAGRRAREAARGGLAFFVAQFLVLSIYSLLVLVALLLLRVRWNASIDGFLDNIRGLF